MVLTEGVAMDSTSAPCEPEELDRTDGVIQDPCELFLHRTEGPAPEREARKWPAVSWSHSFWDNLSVDSGGRKER